MPNPSNALTNAIAGLFGDYKNEGSPAFFRFAPKLGQDPLTGQYMTLATSKFTDSDKLPLRAGFNAQFTELDVDFALANVSITRVAGNIITIPDVVVTSLESTNPQLDVVKNAMDVVVQPMYDRLLTDFITAADTLGTTTGAASLDLTVDNAAVRDTIRANIRDIQKTVGARPNGNWIWYMGPEAFDLLTKQDELFQGPGLAVGTTGDVVRRFGVVDESYVKAWAKSTLGVEIVVEERVNESGFAVTTQSYLGYCPPGMQDGPIKCFYQRVGRAGRDLDDVIGFYNDRSSLPRVPGQDMAVDACYSFEVISTGYARKLPLTIA